ncbi:MAG: hypothetical protein HY879_13665 [Deltaproteobacteria bacterium]|nr:hypothetical protein [Deltaproteobacteria bacterium]
MKFMVALSVLSFLFAFSAGCSASKEAVASPMKVTPVPPAAPAPTVDVKRIESLTKRVETAASLAEAAAKKADLAAQKSEIAGGKAEKAADWAEEAAEKAENAANKAESIFMKKMKK